MNSEKQTQFVLPFMQGRRRGYIIYRGRDEDEMLTGYLPQFMIASQLVHTKVKWMFW